MANIVMARMTVAPTLLGAIAEAHNCFATVVSILAEVSSPCVRLPASTTNTGKRPSLYAQARWMTSIVMAMVTVAENLNGALVKLQNCSAAIMSILAQVSIPEVSIPEVPILEVPIPELSSPEVLSPEVLSLEVKSLSLPASTTKDRERPSLYAQTTGITNIAMAMVTVAKNLNRALVNLHNYFAKIMSILAQVSSLEVSILSLPASTMKNRK